MADEPTTNSQEVFSSTESDDDDDDSSEDNEIGDEEDKENEEEEEDDEVFEQPDLNFPPKKHKKRNGEISPPSFAASSSSSSALAAAAASGKNSAANHGVKMVETLAGDVADVLEVGHYSCLWSSMNIPYPDSGMSGKNNNTSLKQPMEYFHFSFSIFQAVLILGTILGSVKDTQNRHTVDKIN